MVAISEMCVHTDWSIASCFDCFGRSVVAPLRMLSLSLSPATAARRTQKTGHGQMEGWREVAGACGGVGHDRPREPVASVATAHARCARPAQLLGTVRTSRVSRLWETTDA